MDFLHGVFQCWPLSKTCLLNWDAVSAVATTVAVVVALGMGLLPEVNRRREAWVIALAKIHLAESSVEIQMVHVARAIALSRGETLAPNSRREIVREMDMVKSDELRSLLAGSAHFDKASFSVTCKAVVDIDRVKALAGGFADIPDDKVIHAAWFRGLLAGLFLTLDEARHEYAKAIERPAKPFPGMPPEVERLKEDERAEAQASNTHA
ncbi:hypothetical protein EA658_16445 [Pseudoxanthomonas winnipegensis]|uniref:DUF4760 domain-containing protein n=1 Tax=Pseudoxanthomonas winnipegensis TaxID=2480810 RepID=A0ABY1WCG6_9GAMM|nr:hypothetical protein [Pseudoxanthomonas winnipegensis]TAA11252.1 hypothetical protein EA659_07860 [Pseudoxanthomonas winnipegensis]TAA18675.1 hypothetical protein EA658_16445 [Pseudoxanthomonas winnipegensis]TAH73949.1 hypothetical protein EA657_00300 [Pseudoxanthomonas winnipegensis]